MIISNDHHPAGRSVEQLYRRGPGNGRHVYYLGTYMIADCAHCQGVGRIPKCFWIIPVGTQLCDACEGMGKVICGEGALDYACEEKGK